MTSWTGFARAVADGARRGGFALIGLAGLLACGAAVWMGKGELRPALNLEGGAGSQAAVERYVLPISAPLDQGETGLCWVFATLSMLETNYMSRHPGAHVEFSRAALQRDTIADRFRRLIHGETGEPGDGGLAVEAIALIRENGLVDAGDLHGIVNAGPTIASLKDAVAEDAEPVEKERRVDDELTAALGAKPQTTHLEGRPMSPAALAGVVLDGEAWTEFDLARDGGEAWGPSHDPDARPETRVRYVSLDTLVALIHRSLARAESVVAGTDDHAFLIYGADYDADGEPLAYLIKDSFAPYTYRLEAAVLHRMLNDVTVATDGAPPGLADAEPRWDLATARRL